jgi:hypothetical protein
MSTVKKSKWLPLESNPQVNSFYFTLFMILYTYGYFLLVTKKKKFSTFFLGYERRRFLFSLSKKK